VRGGEWGEKGVERLNVMRLVLRMPGFGPVLCVRESVSVRVAQIKPRFMRECRRWGKIDGWRVQGNGNEPKRVFTVHHEIVKL